ncbi:MAG: nitroreductase/quinone reductase family protein [Terriglobales bacterium]|jgi:deazaflavin-dependent oxidoreductase (nitroreductase family)
MSNKGMSNAGMSNERMSDEPVRNDAPRNDTLRDRLSRYREIKITVTGRKSGRAISIPVWFVWEDDKLYLLPVQGSHTQWYKNVLHNAMIRIDARGAEAEVKVVPVADAAEVSSVVKKFRAKYGTDVKKYYSRFDVAVIAQIP